MYVKLFATKNLNVDQGYICVIFTMFLLQYFVFSLCAKLWVCPLCDISTINHRRPAVYFFYKMPFFNGIYQCQTNSWRTGCHAALLVTNRCTRSGDLFLREMLTKTLISYFLNIEKIWNSAQINLSSTLNFYPRYFFGATLSTEKSTSEINAKLAQNDM